MSRKNTWDVRGLRALAVAAVCLNGLFPALWMVLTSLKPEAELVALPMSWLPRHPSLANYVKAFADQPLPTFLFNSFAVGLLSAASSLFVSSLAAYAIGRLRLRGRVFLLGTLVAASMFPLVTLMVPLFETLRAIGLLNSYAALVLPYTVMNLPVCTLVLLSFFQSIPADIENAAMLDGCSRLGALWHVVLPLSAPGVFTAGILAFVNAWDEFLMALSFNATPAMRTLPVGITLYQGEFSFPWPLVSAALVVAIVPVALLIIAFQGRVISGLSAGGMKG